MDSIKSICIIGFYAAGCDRARSRPLVYVLTLDSVGFSHLFGYCERERKRTTVKKNHPS